MKLKSVLEGLAREGVSAVTVNRLKTLANEFATPEAFFAATKGDIMRVAQKAGVGGKRDLGDRFFADFDKALRLWKTPDPTPAPDARRFSKEDLLLVAQMMEMMGIPAMDPAQMATVLDMRREAGK